MGEIVVHNPSINKSFLHDHTRTAKDEQISIILNFLESDIQPADYPNVADLCAGNLDVANILVKIGWKAENIVGFDMLQPDKPTVKEATMEYFDLQALAKALHERQQIPDEVAKYKGVFDIAVMNVGGVDRYLSELFQFFLRTGGIACIRPPTYSHTVLRDREHWKLVPNSNLLAKK